MQTSRPTNGKSVGRLGCDDASAPAGASLGSAVRQAAAIPAREILSNSKRLRMHGAQALGSNPKLWPHQPNHAAIAVECLVRSPTRAALPVPSRNFSQSLQWAAAGCDFVRSPLAKLGQSQSQTGLSNSLLRCRSSQRPSIAWRFLKLRRVHKRVCCFPADETAAAQKGTSRGAGAGLAVPSCCDCPANEIHAAPPSRNQPVLSCRGRLEDHQATVGRLLNARSTASRLGTNEDREECFWKCRGDGLNPKRFPLHRREPGVHFAASPTKIAARPPRFILDTFSSCTHLGPYAHDMLSRVTPSAQVLQRERV